MASTKRRRLRTKPLARKYPVRLAVTANSSCSIEITSVEDMEASLQYETFEKKIRRNDAVRHQNRYSDVARVLAPVPLVPLRERGHRCDIRPYKCPTSAPWTMRGIYWVSGRRSSSCRRLNRRSMER